VRPRPEPGAKTVRLIKVPVCRRCGYAISDGLCDDGCDLDGSGHAPADTILAVYERTDIFLRDEAGA
jgi:hypothetical protein